MSEYYMFNKPAGCITAKRDHKYPVVMDYFLKLNNEKLNPVGRLDLDTEGLLFITDDGRWNQRLMSPEYHVSKKYFFWVLGELDDARVSELCEGVIMHGTDSATRGAKIEVCEFKKVSDLPEYSKGKRYRMLGHNKSDAVVSSGYITITEGKKRQIKRMMKAVGCYVIYLKRVSIGGVVLDENLKPGEYRALTDEEIAILQ